MMRENHSGYSNIAPNSSIRHDVRMRRPKNFGRERALEKELSTSGWPATIRIDKNEGRTPLLVT
jgi:hypothetical protein